MPTLRPRIDDSLVLVVDIQEKFLAPIYEGDRVLKRATFLVQAAESLGVPVLFSEQVPDKLGGTVPSILGSVSNPKTFGKTHFGCFEDESLTNTLKSANRKNLVIAGIETHICVSQTALAALDLGFNAIVCPDAVCARTNEAHKLGMERMRDEGVRPIHTEAVVYEWLGSANHPKFRDVVALVKNSS